MQTTQQSIARQIVYTVADREDLGKTDLPPLQDSVDVDALEELISTKTEGVVAFSYCGYRVIANSEGLIRICEISGDQSQTQI